MAVKLAIPAWLVVLLMAVAIAFDIGWLLTIMAWIVNIFATVVVMVCLPWMIFGERVHYKISGGVTSWEIQQAARKALETIPPPHSPYAYFTAAFACAFGGFMISLGLTYTGIITIAAVFIMRLTVVYLYSFYKRLSLGQINLESR